MSDTFPPKVKGTKTICIPCSETEYERIVDDRSAFKGYIDLIHSVHPEIFPKGMAEGYVFNGFQPDSV